MDKPPDCCEAFWRGILNEEFYDGTGFDHSIFSANASGMGGYGLEGWKGTSINWDLQDGGALNQLMGQPKYKFGAIKIPRGILDALAKRYDNKVAYEIRSEDGNDYHGHILLSEKLTRPRIQSICTRLVDAFIEIHRR